MFTDVVGLWPMCIGLSNVSKWPAAFRAYLAQVLDEAPFQLVTKMVAEVAPRRQRRPSEIWKNLRRLAQALMATRGGLWA
ncbi:hypothetical protein [Cupriavidus malaysiensis]|nr:hypothetical protein [Cupriavidus malaysiensis]